MTLNQQNAQNCSLDICIIILHWTFLHIVVCKGPSSWNLVKVILH